MVILPALAVLVDAPKVIKLHSDHVHSFKALLNWTTFCKSGIDVESEPRQADMVSREHIFDYDALAEFCIVNKKVQTRDIKFGLLEGVLYSWIDMKMKSGHQDHVFGLMGNNPLQCDWRGYFVPACSSICLLLVFISQKYFCGQTQGDSAIESMEPEELIRVLIKRLGKRLDWIPNTAWTWRGTTSTASRQALVPRCASHDDEHGEEIASCRCVKKDGITRVPSEDLPYKPVKEERSDMENDNVLETHF